MLVIRSLDYGGAERQLATLAQHLDRERFAVAVMPFYDGGPLAEELRASGVEVISLKKNGRWDVVGFLWRLTRAAWRWRPHVVYGFMEAANLCALWLRFFTRARAVWGVRVSDVDLARCDWLVRVMFRVACRLSGRADLVICNSQAGRDFHLKRGYPAEKTVVVHNGTDTARFTIARQTGRRARAAWGVGAEEKLVGLVGRLDAIKDHANFLRAAKSVSEECPAARFVCVGDGPAAYLGELQKLAGELNLGGKVIWSRGRGDMPDVYNALDALVLSSYGEGFPNVLAEAMSCGVPCATTDAGDAGLIVGTHGPVAPPKDAQALAAVLLQILNHPPAPTALRSRIVDNFSAEIMARKTGETLISLFKKSAKR
jgi:glycosyltransferase involved in cell wall biosynthesis